MRSRQGHDLSIQALRAFVATIHYGSLTKAAEELNITQPAISAQLKRLQKIVGGDLFVKTATGRGLSELGARLEQYARRIIVLNDQAIAAAGRNSSRRALSVGVQSVFARMVFPELVKLRQSSDTLAWEFVADSAPALTAKYKSGYLDLVAMVAPPEGLPNVTAEWSEQLVWVRSPHNLPVAADRPIPFIGRNNGFIDRIVFDALSQRDVPYAIAFQAGEMATMVAAVEAGLGVFALPERCVPSSLIAARDAVLPELPRVRVVVLHKEGFEIKRLRAQMNAFIAAVQPASAKLINLHPTGSAQSRMALPSL
jgi:DNA-binding transcriptional LysR family regulator